MKTTSLIATVLGLTTLVSPVVFADSDFLNSEMGVIQIFVQDENGSAVANAPVYIVDRHKNLSIKETNSRGTLSLTLQEGDYVLSSAITRPIADSIDRYTSHEARIHVVPQDTIPVVLSLR